MKISVLPPEMGVIARLKPQQSRTTLMLFQYLRIIMRCQTPGPVGPCFCERSFVRTYVYACKRMVMEYASSSQTETVPFSSLSYKWPSVRMPGAGLDLAVGKTHKSTPFKRPVSLSPTTVSKPRDASNVMTNRLLVDILGECATNIHPIARV